MPYCKCCNRPIDHVDDVCDNCEYDNGARDSDSIRKISEWRSIFNLRKTAEYMEGYDSFSDAWEGDSDAMYNHEWD